MSRSNNRRRRPSTAPQPRVEQGQGRGRFTNHDFRDGSDLLPDNDRDRYTARFAELDVFTIEDGRVIDYDPSTGERVGEYQGVLSHGYDNRF